MASAVVSRAIRAPSPPVTASFLLSILIHLLLIVAVGFLMRAMPPVKRPSLLDTPGLRATLVATNQVDPLFQLSTKELPTPEPLPPLDYPVASTDPVSGAISNASPLLRTPLPGISVNPATAVIDEAFLPVGSINSSSGSGRDEFGSGLFSRMLEQFPDQVSRPPRLIGSMPALYPARAAHEGRSQKLSALLMIDAGGNVTEVRIAPDDPPFAAAVLAALKGAHFSAAQRDGKAVPYWTVIEFRFTIDGPTGANGKRLDE